MTISVSLTQLLRGVYADAALMSAAADAPARPAILRHEHDIALRRVAVSAWATIMADILPFLALGEFTDGASGEPDFLVVEIPDEAAGRNSGAIRLQLETALERRILAIAYRSSAPEVSAANDALASAALAALRRLSAPETIPAIRPWG